MLRVDPRLSLAFSPSTQRRFALGLLGSIVVGLLEVVGVVATMPLMLLLAGGRTDVGVLGTLSEVLGNPTRDALAIYIAIAVLICFSTKAVVTVAFRWWMTGMVAEQEIQTSTRILRHYVRMPYIQHVERGTSNLMQHMNDAVSRFYGSVVNNAISVTTEAVSILMILAGLLLTAPLPTLVLLVYFAAASIVVQWFVRSRLADVGERTLALSLANYRATFQVLHGIKEIKLRNKAAKFVDQYRDTRLQIAHNTRLGNLLSELPKYVMELIFIIGVAVATIVVFVRNESDQAIGVLAMFIAAGFRLLPSATRMMSGVNAFRMGLPSADMTLTELEDAQHSELALGRTHDTGARLSYESVLRLEEVSYRYPTSDEDVIRDVSLSIPKGTSVGFVGGSGAGKSTLIDLILGLHDPRAGRILVDGVDIRFSLTDWQRGLAMVPQDVYLTDGSLRENIAFGEQPDEIDEARVESAVNRAQLSELVATLPEGLDTEVGERGGRLSGGQRQRIGIARALYLDPQLLVMDEATSALDNVTESKINDTIRGLSGGITVLVVAHRLSTVRHCDMIVYMKDGRIDSAGTFDEVKSQNPEFARLVDLASLEPATTGDSGES